MKIENVISEAIVSLNENLSDKIEITKGRDAHLYGNHGVLDSLALVSLIVLLEEKIEQQLGLSVILANEKAMSLRHSPFATIGSLTDYLMNLLQKEIA